MIQGNITGMLPVALLLVLRTRNNTWQHTRDISLYHFVLILYVCTYVGTHVCTYVVVYVRMYICIYGRMYVCVRRKAVDCN